MRSTRWSRRGGLALCITAVGYMAACGGETSTTEPAAAPSAAPVASAAPPPVAAAPVAPAPSAAPAASAAPVVEAPPVNPALTDEEAEAAVELAEHHRHHHHGGVTRFIAISIDTLGADEKQKAALEKIEAELDKKLEGSRGKSHAVLLAVADEVAKGAASSAAVDKAIADLAKSSAAVHEASSEALVKLHDILTPAQRKALIDKVHAHWEVWHAVNTDAEAAGEKHPHRGHLGHLAKKLDLAPDQVEKIRAAEKAALEGANAKIDRKSVDSHLEAFGAAFEADKFDPKSLKDSPAGNMSTWGATRMARYYEAMIPVLTKDQRAKLADMLRSHTKAPKAKK